MRADTYAAWYDSPRGRWIGAVEFELLKSLLQPEAGHSLLDVGCGTGHFTRAFARDLRGLVVGVDPNREWLAYARAHAAHGERYFAGRAEALPFGDHAFDYSISVTALCFVADQGRAVRELVRVTRRRFVLGLLNRHSLLYARKGRGGGTGGYRGAHWHTAAEVRALLTAPQIRDLELRSAIVLPQGGAFAGLLERCWPRRILFGGFLAVVGDLTGT